MIELEIICLRDKEKLRVPRVVHAAVYVTGRSAGMHGVDCWKCPIVTVIVATTTAPSALATSDAGQLGHFWRESKVSVMVLWRLRVCFVIEFNNSYFTFFTITHLHSLCYGLKLDVDIYFKHYINDFQFWHKIMKGAISMCTCCWEKQFMTLIWIVSSWTVN